MEASGVRVGVGEDDSNENGVIDGTESHSIGLAGQTTAVLQAPTYYEGIYETWNLDVNVDGEPDAPWHFGTSSQYPALTADLNRNRSATWQEFGYQVRGGLTLTATATEGQAQVVLAWTQVSTSSWSPAPDVTYTLVRDDGTTEEAVEKGATALRYTDTDVTTGATYTYRVTALLDGGEAIRSAPVSVIAGEGNQPPVAVGILEDLFLRVGANTGTVALSEAFRDPESDTLTYGASSSETGVATVTSSAAQLTITPVAGGRAGITVTATDSAGSNNSATQRFTVTVWPANAVDYDTDDDSLIEISDLAQLYAVRHDLDGDGTPTARRKNSYDRAFANAVEWMGCSLSVGCRGYELTVDLDFDTNGNGAADAADEYWNGGAGWVPIGGAGSTLDAQAYHVENPFTANFEGNGHTVSHLFIGTDTIFLVGLFGFAGSSSNIRNLGLIDADVSGPELAAGLVGLNRGKIRSSYVTGRVSSINNVGGLVGINSLFAEIRGSYATSHVSGDDDVGGLVGDNRGEIVASYATGRAAGNTDVGGLVGNNKSTGEISAGYATGTVSGGSNVDGLIGLFEGGSINASYWDKQTSGHATGVLPFGRTTAQLQSPRSYSGIYGSWNLDINGDSVNDDPWDFGTSSQYPALRADRNGDGDATWEEFGHQLRSGPTLTATATTNAGQSQVELEWTEVPLSSEWTPAPSLSYTVTRDDGATLETIAENLTAREYTDTDVAGETYIYQVAAVVNGGEAVRSATVSVTVVGNSRPVLVGTLPDRTLRVGDSAMTEVAGAFRDPEGDTITYGVSSSDPTIASVTVAGTRVTMVSVGAGQVTITVTATDETGSNKSRTQRFTVTVLPTTTTDYDADDDGLIEISNPAQLDAVRHDLDGNGVPTTTGARSYARAFANGSAQLACGGLFGCVGYELSADPDFDTDNSGEADAGDTYWNGGAGWVPIGDSSDSFSAIFEGNGETITNLFIDRSGNDVGLFGETTSSAVIRNLELVAVQVTGTDNVGGLVGSNGGAVSGCFATGKVTGDDDVGGLVGSNLNDGSVTVSYSTVQVAGDDRIGGLAGSNRGEVTAAYATGRIVGDSEAGGLIGRNTGDVNVSYATGLVSGRSTIGGLVGRNTGGGAITDSYWDTDTSGRASGSYGQPQTTANLQTPTDAAGIYQNWNLDLDGDSRNDAPWVFGTSSQYPVLSVDTNGVGGATWQEFGRQIRAGPALMATPALGRVTLIWSAVSVSGVTYNLYRTSGTTVEILSENTSSRAYVDTDVTAGATYVYQVAAVINGGEASRSTRVSVVVPIPDTTDPTVSKLEITSDAGSDSTYAIRDVIEVTVTFSEDVFVTGTPQLTLRVGDQDRTAIYDSVTDAEVLFRYRVVVGDVDTNGVSIAADSLSLNGGTLKDGSDNEADLDHRALGTQSRHKVDGIQPELAATRGAVVNGAALTLTYTETLDSASTPPSGAFFVSGGSSSRTVSDVALRGSAVDLTLSSAVAHWETGIRVSYTVPAGMGATPIQDRAGNDADGLSGAPVTNETPDRIPPTVTSVEITSDPPDSRDVYGIGEEIEVTVTFSETVTVTGTPRVTLKVGERDRSANYESVMGAVVVFAYTVATNDSDTDGVSIEADSLTGTIRDTAGNHAVLTHSAVAADTGQKVDGIKPVLASTDGAVANGTMLTLAYSEPLDTSSAPGNDAFTVTGGSETRAVTGVRVSGNSVELTLTPAVEHWETGLRVSYTVPTGASASPIQDTAGNDADRLINKSVTNNTGDTGGPTVEMVRITSNAGSDRTYAVEDLIEVTVTFDETVVVTGTPRLTLNVGGRNRTADYLSVTGAAVKFEYRVARGDNDRDGVSIDADSLSRGGGTIRDGARNNAQLDHAAVAADSRHKVDGVPPVLATTDGAVVNGTTLTLAYSEPLRSSSRPATSAFTVTGGSETRTVTRVQVSGNAVLLTLNPAVTDTESGLRLNYQPGGNPIEDVVGNAADELNNRTVTNRTGDMTGPTVETVRITSNAGSDQTYAAGETIEVTVTFSETVVVTGTPRLTLNLGGRNRTANYQDVTGAAVRFEYKVVSGDSAAYGVSLEANRLSGGTIRDGARNKAVRNHAPVAADSRHQVDGIKPTLATSDGAVASGTTLALAYGEPLDSSSVPATDDFTVTGGSETRTVTGVRVSGSAVFLTLSPAVADGERGLRVSYEPGSDPIQDTAGNDADRLSNKSVTNRTGDTTGPAVLTVRITSSAGSDRTYGVDETIEVTVTFDETVVVTGTPQLTLNLGGRSRTANFRSVKNQAVKFAYRVVPGDNDGDGVSIEANSLSRGTGTIRDGARNDATLDHAAVAADARHQVDGILPVLATTDGAVVNGTMLTLAYSEPLRSSSRPATSVFTVTGGNETRTVTRVQVSGSAVFLTLSPAVEEGETGLRLSYQPGGNLIEDTVGNAADGLNNQPVTNRTGDTTGPTVETVRIISNAGSDATYAAGETIEVTVTFSETVVVTGTPRLTLNLGGRNRTANYQDVTGAAVRFEYQVVSGDTAPYGVSLEANRLSGGTIRDGARNNAVLSHAPVAADSRHQVDGVKPTLATTDGAVVNGTTLTLAYGEPLDSSSVPATDDFTVTAGSETRTVTGVRVSGSAVFLTLSSAVADGESRLRVNYEPRSNPIQDTAGNDADRLSNRSVTNRTADTMGPAVSTVRITSGAGPDRTYGVDETIEVTVTFEETVVITGTPEVTLDVGGRSRTAEYRSVSNRAVKFAYRVVTGDNDEDGVSLEANRLSRSGGTIQDGAGNNAVLDHEAVAASSSHKVDAVAPVLADTDPAVVNGATLTLTYNEPLNTSSRPATSDFTVEGGNETRTVTRIQVSGSEVRLTVNPAAEHGETGIRVSYEPRSNPIQDAIGNDAEAFRDQFVDNRTPDTTAPSIEGIEISSDPGTDETYAVDDMISVTVRYDETVTVDTIRGTPTLDLLVGTRRKRASASLGPDRPAVVFVYTVEKGDEDEDGVSVPRGSIFAQRGKDPGSGGQPGGAELRGGGGEAGPQGGCERAGTGERHGAGSRVAVNYDEPLDEARHHRVPTSRSR